MRKKISKLKWNFFSILITILLGLGFYHFYIVPKANEYRINHKIEFRVICELKNNGLIYDKDFCKDYQSFLKNFIMIHLVKIYNLSEKVHVKIGNNISYYTIKTFNFKYDAKSIDSLNNIILYQSDIFKNQMNIILVNENSTKLLGSIKNLQDLTKVYNDKVFMIKYKDLLKIEEIMLDNIRQFTRLNKTYEDLKPEQMYSLKVKKEQIKSLLYPKFKRLNYTNVFLSAFIFGILINVLFALIIEIKKLYKW